MTSYTMQEQANGGGFATIGNDGSGTLNICGKGNGTYGYRVQGCNVSGCGPFSATATVTVALLPSVPTGLAASLVNPNKGIVDLTWSAAAGATDYKIKYTSSGGNGTSDAGSATTWNGLYRPVHGQITFNVEGCNAVGCSAWSAGFTTGLNSN